MMKADSSEDRMSLRIVAISTLVLALAACNASPGSGSGATDAAGADATKDATAAVAAQQRGEVDEAVRLYSRAIDAGTLSDANLSALYYNRSLIYVNKGQYQRAVADCDAAIRLRPSYAEALANRAVAHVGSGQLDLAIPDLDAAIRLKPDYGYAYAQRGVAYARKNNFDHAIVDYTEAIRLRPDIPDIYVERGVAYTNLAQFDRALADYGAAVRLKPDSASVYLNRGYIYALEGQQEDAIADFDATLRLIPKTMFAYYRRGLSELALGRFDAAAIDLSRGLELAPNNAFMVAWLHMARVKSAVDDRDEFTRHVAQVDQSAWPYPVLALYLGRVTPEQFHAAAGNDDPVVARARDCFAAIHIGEYQLFHQNLDAAKSELRHTTADTCPNTDMVKVIAVAELRRLGD
jgi:tetratricopeptide (TPR) repeat protein